MSLIFNWDARKGTLIDSVSKTAGTNSSSLLFKKGNKGKALECLGNNKFGIVHDINLDIGANDAFSVVTAFKFKEFVNQGSAWNVILGYTSNSIFTNGFGLAYTNPVIDFIINGTTKLISLISMINGKEYLLIITRDVNGNLSMYINNELVKTGTDTTAFNGLDAYTGYEGTNTREFYGNIYYNRLYNTALNTQERNNLYKEFLRSSPIEKPIRNFTYPKPTDLSSEVDSKVGDNLINSNISDWVEASATIIDSTSFSTIDKGGILKDVGLIVGKKYKLILDLSSTATSFTLYNANSAANVLATSNGIYEFVALSSYLYLKNQSAGTTSINIFECKELSGLVAAYNMIPSNGTLVDISGNGNNGTITGALSTKDGIKTEALASASYVLLDIAINPNIETLQFNLDIKNLTTNHTIYQHFIYLNRGYRLYVTSAGDIKLQTHQSGASATASLQNITTGKHTLTLAIDNTNSMVYSTLDGLTQEYSITSYMVGLAVNRILGDSGGGLLSMDGVYMEFRRYNYLLSNEQAAYHNSFIKPDILEDFSNNAIGDTL